MNKETGIKIVRKLEDACTTTDDLSVLTALTSAATLVDISVTLEQIKELLESWLLSGD